MWVRSLGWKDPLVDEMATHSSILAWKCHGQRSLAGYSPRGRKQSDTLSAHTHTHTQCCISFRCTAKWNSYRCVCAPLQSHVWLFVTSWTAALQASLSFTISWSLLKFTSTELAMLPNHLSLCLPFLLLASVFPSIRVFLNELALHITWPKYWSFRFSTSPSNEYSGLIYTCIYYFSGHFPI